MVHYSLVKMTSQMVYTLLVKKTTPITLNMLKSIYQNDKRSFWPLSKFGFFNQNFWVEKLRILVVIKLGGLGYILCGPKINT
jgi:hypothetical protein